MLAKPWIPPGSPDSPKGIADCLVIGCPKTFIHVGEAEIHLDAIHTLRGRLLKLEFGEYNARYTVHADVMQDIFSFSLLGLEKAEV